MYKDLIVWQKAYDFVLEIYKTTQSFPVEERYSLTSQMRRAASSIPANIAEGSMRQSTKEYKRFLLIARGSMAEMEVWLKLAHDLEYMPKAQYIELDRHCEEIGKLLNGLHRSL